VVLDKFHKIFRGDAARRPKNQFLVVNGRRRLFCKHQPQSIPWDITQKYHANTNTSKDKIGGFDSHPSYRGVAVQIQKEIAKCPSGIGKISIEAALSPSSLHPHTLRIA
jgi:hypothetical protein